VNPESLKCAAISFLSGLKIGAENLGYLADSAYRDVYEFSFNGKSFVVKINKDKFTRHGDNEIRAWEALKDSPVSKILCPVLASGLFNGKTFVVQKKLKTLFDHLGKNHLNSNGYKRAALFWETVIFPNASKAFPDLSGEYEVPGVIFDMHEWNWGEDSDGNWLCFDYGDSFC
jgi:hypothetical protein